MKKIVIVTLIFSVTSAIAQETILKPQFPTSAIDSITYLNFNNSLESFFHEIGQGKINEKWLTPQKGEFTKTVLQEIVNYEIKKDSLNAKIQDKQLINLYPISTDKYFTTISYISYNRESDPMLVYIINIIATEKNNEFTFSIPIDYLTRYWKVETIGNITYHFREEIDKERAALFNSKNSLIAGKLGLKPERLDFYMCDDFQEISALMGYGYSVYSKGIYRDGYGVDAKTIFSIMNNEDFSHDIFHYYSGQINQLADRNGIAEEGIAYLWGNAYYTDHDGEMITHGRLMGELKKYMSAHPNTDLFHLFENNDKIFNDIAPEISVSSIISGMIANEIEQEKGMVGILKLINAGRKDRMENYLRVTNELLGINKDNFNEKVTQLLEGN